VQRPALFPAYRRCILVRLWRSGSSSQFGRTSAPPMVPHLLHTMRGPNEGMVDIDDDAVATLVALDVKRADAVVAHIGERHGVAGQRSRASGHAERGPSPLQCRGMVFLKSLDSSGSPVSLLAANRPATRESLVH
jgi:hypothetical protein